MKLPVQVLRRWQLHKTGYNKGLSMPVPGGSHQIATKVLIEDKGSGTPLIQELKREGLLFIRAYEPPTGADKVMRLFAQSHHFESGKVMLPSTASWLDEYRRELTAFPGSKHDDQVDSTTQALHYMSSNTTGETWARWAKL